MPNAGHNGRTFKFAWLVELLQNLDAGRPNKAVTTAKNVDPDYGIVIQWFQRYGQRVIRHGESGIAFLSCLFPERLPRRSYGVQQKRLASIFSRALGLGHG